MRSWDLSQKVYSWRSEINQADSTYKTYRKVCFPEHIATHLVAPVHINTNGPKVAAIPLDSLIAPGN